MRVLLVEDDATTAASIKMMLGKENFMCDATDLGEDGLEIGKLYKDDYDIILLDLMLPDIDGYEMLRRLRAARVRTPILILSGLGELDHKLKGLGFGADDFLTKPFDRRELVARIQAIVRRSKGHSESTIRTGKLVVNLDTRVVSVEDQPVHLTGKVRGFHWAVHGGVQRRRTGNVGRGLAGTQSGSQLRQLVQIVGGNLNLQIRIVAGFSFQAKCRRRNVQRSLAKCYNVSRPVVCRVNRSVDGNLT